MYPKPETSKSDTPKPRTLKFLTLKPLTQLWISTGPRAPYTHWRQTVMYLHDQLSVSKDEKVTGSMTCKPNPSNHRDLDFEISYKHTGKV